MLGFFYVLSMFYSKCQIADIININIVTNKTMCKILHHGILSLEFTGTFLISLHAIIESPTILFKYIPVSKKNVPGFQIQYFLHV